MLRFYYNAAPNPLKVALFLEEAKLPYTPVPVDTKIGEQHGPEFLEINPNGKVPAIDDDGVRVFDSNAILLYLAEKTGQFLPTAERRGELLSWLMFVASGVGPYSGQAIHFRHFAPERLSYPIKRYDFEARRHWRIIDERLGLGRYMMGDDYTIVDMAVWGWAHRVPFMLPDAVDFAGFENLKRLIDEIDARPAVAGVERLKQLHRFKAEFDEDAMRNLYPQIFAPDPE
jgi:GST-like protein